MSDDDVVVVVVVSSCSSCCCFVAVVAVAFVCSFEIIFVVVVDLSDSSGESQMSMVAPGEIRKQVLRADWYCRMMRAMDLEGNRLLGLNRSKFHLCNDTVDGFSAILISDR